MKRLLSAVGPVPRVIVTILGVLCAGLVLLGLLILVSGEIEAFLGAMALAIVVATLMAIVYFAARVVRMPPNSRSQLPPPPQQPPVYPPQQTPTPEQQRLYNPDDLR